MMHPKAFEHWVELRDTLPGHPFVELIPCAQHFYTSRAITAQAVEVAQWELDIARKHDLPASVPSTARLPAGTIILTIHWDGVDCPFYLTRGIRAGEVHCADFRGGQPKWFGGWHESGAGSFSLDNANVSASDQLNDNGTTRALAFIVSLINLPRKVERHVETVSRQFRKKVTAATGQPSMGYVRVAWQVGGKTKPKKGVADDSHGVALHWCRAHFAIAKEGQPKAEWLNIPGRGWGWWRWVADSWKGHPNFGIKLHSYVPHIEDRCPQVAKFPTFTASSAERLAYLDTAKVQALRAAGLAA